VTRKKQYKGQFITNSLLKYEIENKNQFFKKNLKSTKLTCQIHNLDHEIGITS